MRARMNRLTGLLILGLIFDSINAANAALALRTDTDVATAGYFQLQWEAGDVPLRLIESTDPGFENRRVMYEGLDTASSISGKSDGQYYYRLERADSKDASGKKADVVSNVLQVSVRHHSLSRALTFLAIGAGVFVATLILVLIGGRSERRQ